MINVRTLGLTSITLFDRPVTPSAERQFAFLLYLALERTRPVERLAFQELLFPDQAPSNASHSLRQLVYKLKTTGVRFATASSTFVALDPAGLTVDIDQLQEGPLSQEVVAALAHGYLPNYSPAFSAPLRDWADSHRATVERQLRVRLVRQLLSARAQAKWDAVETLARACLRLDPLNEEATLALAEAAASLGAKSDALQILAAYEAAVGRSQGALKLPASLLRHRISESAGYGPEEEMFGRDAELEGVETVLAAVKRGATAVAVVEGGPGIGKSLLLLHVRRRAAIHDFAIIYCVPHPNDREHDLSILSPLISQAVDLPGSLGASPDALDLLRRYVAGELQLPSNAFGSLVTALLEVFAAISAEGPIAIVIDDADYLDNGSLHLIAALRARSRNGRIAFILSARPPANGLMAALGTYHLIALGVLNAGSSYAMLRKSASKLAMPVGDATIASWVASSGGHPTYLRMMLSHFSTTGELGGLPATLDGLINARVRALSKPARRLLAIASVLDTHCTLALLDTVGGMLRHETLDALQALEADGMVLFSENSVRVSPLVRDITLRDTGPATLALLHRYSAEAMVQSGTGASNWWAVSQHWERSGDSEAGAHSLALHAHRLESLGRPEEAASAFLRAATLAQSDSTCQEHLRRAVQLALPCSAVDIVAQAAYLSEQRLLSIADTSSEAALIAICRAEAAFFSYTFDGTTRILQDVCQDASLSSALRCRAAAALAGVASGTGDEALGAQLLVHLADIPLDESSRLWRAQTEMAVEIAFGSAQRGAALAQEQLATRPIDLDHSLHGKLVRRCAVVLHRAGHSTAALEALRQYLRGNPDPTSAAAWELTALTMSRVAYESGYTDMALAYSELARRTSYYSGRQQSILAWHAGQIRIQLARNETVEARRLYDIAHGLLLQIGHPFFRLSAYALQIRLEEAEGRLSGFGDPAAAILAFRDIGKSDSDDIVAAQILLHVARGEPAAGKAVLDSHLWARRDRSPLWPELREAMARLDGSSTPRPSRLFERRAL